MLVAPLIPGVNDDPEQVEELLGLLGEAGAESVSGIGLHLRGEVKEIWFDWLRQYRPDLVPRYEKLYRRGAYLPQGRGPSGSRSSRAGRSRPRRLRVRPGGRARARYGGAAAGTPAQALLSESATVTVPSAHAAASTNAAE